MEFALLSWTFKPPWKKQEVLKVLGKWNVFCKSHDNRANSICRDIWRKSNRTATKWTVMAVRLFCRLAYCFQGQVWTSNLYEFSWIAFAFIQTNLYNEHANSSVATDDVWPLKTVPVTIAAACWGQNWKTKAVWWKDFARPKIRVWLNVQTQNCHCGSGECPGKEKCSTQC